MKIKNLNIYNKTPEQFRILKEEYEAIGFTTRLYEDKLVVFALAPKKEKKKDDKRKKNSSHTSGRREQARKVKKVSG